MASSVCWSATHGRTAPRKLPRWTSPVGWMPENTRAMPRIVEGRPVDPGTGYRTRGSRCTGEPQARDYHRPDALRGADPGLRGALRPAAPPDPVRAGRP